MSFLWLLIIIKVYCEIIQYDEVFECSNSILLVITPPSSGYFTLTTTSIEPVNAYLKKDLKSSPIYWDTTFTDYIFLPSFFFLKESVYYLYLQSLVPFKYIFTIVYSKPIIDNEYFYFSALSMQQHIYTYKVPSNISYIEILSNHDINNENLLIIRKEKSLYPDILANY